MPFSPSDARSHETSDKCNVLKDVTVLLSNLLKIGQHYVFFSCCFGLGLIF